MCESRSSPWLVISVVDPDAPHPPGPRAVALLEAALEGARQAERLAMHQAIALGVGEAIRERDLVPRLVPGEPTLAEFFRAVLRELEEHGKSGPGTLVGAFKIVVDLGRAMNVPGAQDVGYWRRTQAQVDAAPNPKRRREGKSAPKARPVSRLPGPFGEAL